MSNAEIPQFSIAPPAAFDVPESDIHVRLFDDADVDSLLKLAKDLGTRAYVPWTRWIHDADSAQRMLRNFRESHERKIHVRYAVEKGGAFAGYIGVWPDATVDYYDVGYAVLAEFRGQGIATRAVRRLIEILKSELHAKGVVAGVDDINDASKTVVLKLGLQATDKFDAGERRYELVF